MTFFCNAVAGWLWFCLILACPAIAQSMNPSHPLDALTPSEIAEGVQLLRQAGLASDATRFPAFTLLEPPKSEVMAWQTGQPISRRAYVVMRDSRETSEATIDLSAARLISSRKLPNAQPMIMDAEWSYARDRFMADPRFKSAITRRGLGKGHKIFCTPNSAGYYPEESYANRRILKVPCFDDAEKLHPNLARPIEGLMGVVDTETGDVLDVLDREVIVALPPAPAGYGNSVPLPDRPAFRVDIVADQGSNIKLTENLKIVWNHWSFRARADKRAGLILSLVRFNDDGNDRLIAYQMNLSEIFVPYMDPDPTWSYRTFLDAGEFGLGYLISSLQEEVDCPPFAIMIDLTFPDDLGGAYMRPRAACLFERATGDPAWRHYSTGSKKLTGRAETELVMRFAPALGNYDYIVDYVFSANGNIKARVGATGFDAIKSVVSADMEAPTAPADTEHGALIAPFTVAPNHDHYFSFRFDLDIDGPENTLEKDSFVPETLAGAATRKSMWLLKTSSIGREAAIEPDHMATGGENYRVSNPNRKTALKYSPSYWLHMGHSVTSVLDHQDPPQKRGDFSSHSLWVTKYKPDELWAAGDFPNLSHGGDGLPRYVSDSEAIDNKDLVVWLTLGFRHAPRPEDFPILPTFWHEMTFRPYHFFDRDPSSRLNVDYAPPLEQAGQ
jgi:primary-amine oxidase